MKNVNKNAKKALWSSEKVYISHNSLDGFVIGSGQDFTIEATFVIRNMANGFVYSQAEGFEFGIEDEKLYFELKGFGKVEQDIDIQITTNEMYFGAVTCCNNNLSLYLNGALIGSNTASGIISSENTKAYDIGRYMDCYITDLRLLSAGLTENEVQQDCSNSFCEREGILFWSDFTTSQYKDKGPNQLSLWTSGGIAKCVNIVGCTKLTSNGGYFILQPNSYVNGYSLLCRIYPDVEANQKMYICSVIEMNSGAAILSLCLQPDDMGGKVVYIENDNKIYHGTECLLKGKWIDIALCINGSDATVYVDGEKQFSFIFDGKLENVIPVIGMKPNEKKANYKDAFRGYLDYVSEFNTVLTDTEVEFFANEQPYMFDKGLTANYMFCCGSPIELLTGNNLYAVGNGKFLFEKELNELSDETGIDMHIPNQICDEWNNLSEYEQWLMTLTMNCVREVYTKTYGVKIKPETSPIEQVATAQIRNRFKNAMEAIDTAFSEEEITTASEELVSIAATASAAGGVAMISGAGSSSSFLEGLGPIMAALVAGIAIELGIILTKRVSIVINDDENKKPENEDAELEVLATCCNHQGNPATGSLHFHSDPELTKPETMIYSKSDGRIDMDMFLIPPKISADGVLFDVTVINKSATPYEGSVFISESFTFKEAFVNIKLAAGEQKILTFYLHLSNVNLQNLIDYREETLQFFYKNIKSETKYICSCNCRIYLGSALPCVPWKLQKTDDNIPENYDSSVYEYPSLFFMKVHMIDTLNNSVVYNQNSGNIGVANEVIKRLIENTMLNLFNRGSLSYDIARGASHFTRNYYLFLLNSYNRSQNNYRTNLHPITVNCTDCANIVSLMFALLRYTIRMGILTGPGIGFNCNQIQAIPSNAWSVPFQHADGTGGFSYHQVCCDTNGNMDYTTPIYDLCLNIDIGDYPGLSSAINAYKLPLLPTGLQASANIVPIVNVNQTVPFHQLVYKERLVASGQTADFMAGTFLCQPFNDALTVTYEPVFSEYLNSRMKLFNLESIERNRTDSPKKLKKILKNMMIFKDKKFNRSIWESHDENTEIIWYQNDRNLPLGRHIAEVLTNYSCLYHEESIKELGGKIFVGAKLLIFVFHGNVLAIHADNIGSAKKFALDLVKSEQI